MTNHKNTKKALLSSVIALILCFSMLIGTTFAWFTDSVSSGVNQIIAGNLDVELYHQNASTSGKVTEYTEALFGDVTLWEPGAVAYEKLTVANEGTLDLKYQLSINFTNENKLNGNGLSTALQVAVVDGDIDSREAAIAAGAGKWENLKDFTLPGTLEDGKSDTYTIVIYWEPSDDDNLWNVNNGQVADDGEDYLHIDLGVKLVATQLMSEEDSFGKDYDEGAYLPVVYNAAELASALENGESVKLGADIELTSTVSIPADTTVTLDLNGKTLSGDLGLDADGNRVHVLKNYGTLTLVNGTVTSKSINGGSAIYNAGTLTVKDATIVGAPTDISVGTASYAINTAGAGSELTVINSNISGRGAIGATEGTKVIVNGGTYNIPECVWGHVIYAVDEGTEVIINGGTFSESYDASDAGWTYMIYSGDNAKVTVNGGTFKEWDNLAGYDLTTANGGTIEIKGGTFAVDPANQNGKNYVADGYAATQNADGSWTVAR